jgi:hypothetical protein
MTIRPELTGRKLGAATPDIGHNGGSSLDPIPPSWTELQRVINLKEASRLSGLSVDTIRRRHSDKIIDLSPRRRGMRIRDALMLAQHPKTEVRSPPSSARSK